MTQYVSPITQMIAWDGVAVRMAAEVPRGLPERLVPVALTKGVVEYGAAGSAASAAPLEATVEEVIAAIRALMEEGNAKSFGTTGEPKLPALKAKVGKPVTDAVRDEAWAAVKAEA